MEEAAAFLVSRAHDLDFTAKDMDQSLMLLQQVLNMYNRCTGQDTAGQAIGDALEARSRQRDER